MFKKVNVGLGDPTMSQVGVIKYDFITKLWMTCKSSIPQKKLSKKNLPMNTGARKLEDVGPLSSNITLHYITRNKTLPEVRYDNQPGC